MEYSKFELLKKTVDNLRDENELKVGHKRTYDIVRNWLIMPVEKKGCGFDATFVDRIMPVVVQRVADGDLKFDPAIDFDIYLRDLCMKYETDVLGSGAAIREKLFWTEFTKQQTAGLQLLKDLTDRNKFQRRLITWLLIITALSLSAVTLALAPVLHFLPDFLRLGGF